MRSRATGAAKPQRGTRLADARSRAGPAVGRRRGRPGPAPAVRRPTTGAVAVVLSGSRGSGLFPLTRDREKLAVPFGGQWRLIDFVLSNCLNSGLRHVRVAVDRRSLVLDRHLQGGWAVFRTPLGEFLEVVAHGEGESPPKVLGLGGPLCRSPAEILFQAVSADWEGHFGACLALLGERVHVMDYRPLLAAHERSGADLTVAMVPAPEGGRGGAGDRAEEGGLVPLGAYVFRPGLLRELSGNSALRGRGADLDRDVLPAAAEAGRTFTYVPRTRQEAGERLWWRDLRTIDSYHDATMGLLRSPPCIDLHDPRWPVRTCLGERPPLKLLASSRGVHPVARRCLIGEGCVVDGGEVERSVLFPGSRVGPGASVRESVLMEGSTVGPGAVVRKAIVEEGAHVPGGCRVGVEPDRDRTRYTVSSGGVAFFPGAAQ